MNTGLQFTVFLENKPGRLLNICSALAKDKVSIQAMTVTDSKENSVLRFVADKEDLARQTLQRIGTPFSESEVVLVELKHQTGALANLCEQLASEHVNIDYIYCSAGNRNGKTVAILKATPLNKVKHVLQEAPAGKPKAPIRRAPVRKG